MQMDTLRICSLFRPLHKGGGDDWASRAGLRFCTELWICLCKDGNETFL